MRRRLAGRGDEHRVQPRVISITQATELGTVYTPAEIKALARIAHGGGLWLEHARCANAAARQLAREAARLPGVRIVRPVEANAVFVELPRNRIAAARKRRFFYTWDEAAGVARWVCSFDTTPRDVHSFIADIRAALRG